MTKRYIKHFDDKILIKHRNEIVVIKNGKQHINPKEELLFEDGWVEFVEPEQTEEQDAKQEAENAAMDARELLKDTDYKIIKCIEAFLCGEDLPYNIQELHVERNDYRRIINENEM